MTRHRSFYTCNSSPPVGDGGGGDTEDRSTVPCPVCLSRDRRRESWYLSDGLEQVRLVRGTGGDAAMATQLEGGHEGSGQALLLLGQAVLVIMQHLVQEQSQLGAVLGRTQVTKS